MLPKVDVFGRAMRNHDELHTSCARLSAKLIIDRSHALEGLEIRVPLRPQGIGVGLRRTRRSGEIQPE